jgi:hypothetical protein
VKIYALVAVVMVSAFVFLAGILASPYKSILLPVNIPVEFNFESVEFVLAEEYGESPYAVVLASSNGSELLRLTPEEARDALKIVANNVNGNGKLVWGSSSTLNFYATSTDNFRPLKVELSGPFATNGIQSTEVVGIESGWEGVLVLNEGSAGIAVQSLKWPLAGRTIPVASENTETGTWVLTTMQDLPVSITVDNEQKITMKYVSLFTSPNLYAKNLITGQGMPIPFETTVYGSINPLLSDLPSYINSQIYMQSFGWLLPVAALMAIIWVDDRYRRKIRKVLRTEISAE